MERQRAALGSSHSICDSTRAARHSRSSGPAPHGAAVHGVVTVRDAACDLTSFGQGTGRVRPCQWRVLARRPSRRAARARAGILPCPGRAGTGHAAAPGPCIIAMGIAIAIAIAIGMAIWGALKLWRNHFFQDVSNFVKSYEHSYRLERYFSDTCGALARARIHVCGPRHTIYVFFPSSAVCNWARDWTPDSR